MLSNLVKYLKLFHAQVQPIAQYGVELWGLDKAAVHAEKVDLFGLQKFLCIIIIIIIIMNILGA